MRRRVDGKRMRARAEADATASPLPARAAMSHERRVIAARKTGTYIGPSDCIGYNYTV